MDININYKMIEGIVGGALGMGAAYIGFNLLIERDIIIKELGD